MKDKSFLSNLPDEIRQYSIFQRLSLKELCSLTSVSKHWKNLVERDGDASNVSQLTEWLSPLDKVISIEPHQMLRKFREIKQKIAAARTDIKNASFKKKISYEEIFQEAVKKGDCDIVHGLLKEHEILVKTFIEQQKIDIFADSSIVVNYYHNPVYYLWRNKGNPDLVKLLLMYGADPMRHSKMKKIFSQSFSGKLHVEEKTIPVLYNEKYCSSSSSLEILSLIYIQYAEHFFQLSPPKENQAINSLQKSYRLNPELVKKYIEEVINTKQGFASTYDKRTVDILDKLYETFTDDETSPILSSQDKQQPCCLVF